MNRSFIISKEKHRAGEARGAHVTQSLVGHEDMAGGLHNGIKRSQGSDFAAVAQDLVTILHYPCRFLPRR
jgi:hypothetical protein